MRTILRDLIIFVAAVILALFVAQLILGGNAGLLGVVFIAVPVALFVMFLMRKRRGLREDSVPGPLKPSSSVPEPYRHSDARNQQMASSRPLNVGMHPADLPPFYGPRIMRVGQSFDLLVLSSL